MVNFSSSKYKKVFILFLCLSFVLVSCTSDDKNDVETTTSKKSSNPLSVGDVKYEKCAEFLCATIKVPLDYDKPKGRKIDIAIKTLSAADPRKRKGILLINPGGPGASGVDFVSYATYIISPEVLDVFDVVGWDPRGVGESTKPECSNDSLDYLFDGIDYSPDTDQEFLDMVRVNKKIGKDCTDDDSELSEHLTTIESAKDMDEIRKALGEKQLNYLGYSYGTALGQIYATLFPENYRSLVIDGVVDVGADPLEQAGEQGIGFSKAFDSFFEYCKEKTCKYANGQDPKTVFTALAQKIDAIPIIDDGRIAVGPAQFDLGTGVYMYGGLEQWPSLDDALVKIQAGDTSGIISGFNSYLGRDNNGEYDGTYTAFLSILCADGSLASGDELFNYAKEINNKAPLFGEAVVLFGIQCSYWPNVKEAKPFKVNNSKGNKIMVLGTTGDPATPVQASRDVAKKLKNSIYVEFEGEGHTAYGRSNSCVSDVVDEYLLKQTAPKKTSYC